MVSGPAFIRDYAPAIGDNVQTLVRLAPEMVRAGQWARGVQGGHGSEPVTPFQAWNMAIAPALPGFDIILREVPGHIDLLNQAIERWPGEWTGPRDRSDDEAARAARLVQQWTDHARGRENLPTSGGFEGTAGRFGPALIDWIARPEGQELRGYFGVNGFHVDISNADGMTVEFAYSTSDKREFVSHFCLPPAILTGRQLSKWFRPLMYPAAYIRRIRIPFRALEIAADLISDPGTPARIPGSSDEQTKTTTKAGPAATLNVEHSEYATRAHMRKQQFAVGRSHLHPNSGEDHHAPQRHTFC